MQLTRVAILPLMLGAALVAGPSTAAGPSAPSEATAVLEAEELIRVHSRARLHRDYAALERFRPGFRFWSNVFTIPDGRIAFGSARDGRLLASFPVGGDWSRGAHWEEKELARLLEGRTLARGLSDRRDQVAALLEPVVGPVVHNPTRGGFLRPNARRYGSFLDEWGRIYERFGVPAEIGLAQAVVESGLSGTIESEARATGFCQWLPRNWTRLDRLTPYTIEVENQTTQAAFCAAFLTVLATKYGSFIPALSEHHAGIVNVGRTVVNGERLGAEDLRERYLVGGQFARDVRVLSPRTYGDVVGTYGPRSFLYSEMVFGNAPIVEALREATPQERIFAMRTARAVPLAEVVRRSGLSAAEVKRFNPALARQVPRGATVYLPAHVDELGTDISFWHRPAPAFADVLHDFLRLDAPLESWQEPAFDDVLDAYRRRFRATGSEEGMVMDAVLAYVLQEMPLSRRILTEYRADSAVHRLFEDAVRLRDAQSPIP